MKKKIDEWLEGNQTWAKRISEQMPDCFNQLALAQKPGALWIGCSDSRVPETTITDSLPGTFFVHRNIANLVIPTDISILSVIDYAVRVLQVQHIIICGHYGCGGVLSAMSNNRHGFLDHWLLPIKMIANQHQKELDTLPDQEKRSDRLVELNILGQINHIAQLPTLQEAWQTSEFPKLHGWVYDLKHGLLKNLYPADSNK